MKESDLPRRVRTILPGVALSSLLPCDRAEIKVTDWSSELVYVGGKWQGNLVVSPKLTGQGLLDQPRQYRIETEIRDYQPLRADKFSLLDKFEVL